MHDLIISVLLGVTILGKCGKGYFSFMLEKWASMHGFVLWASNVSIYHPHNL